MKQLESLYNLYSELQDLGHEAYERMGNDLESDSPMAAASNHGYYLAIRDVLGKLRNIIADLEDAA